MQETSTITIVFRGLMVFRSNADTDSMEIGILRADNHIPRILTIKNSVLYSVDVIPTELLDSGKPWKLAAIDPDQPGVRTYTNENSTFDRKTHGDDKDFRWIMDLEGNEFYGRDLSAEMATKKLMPIISVPQGEFYTRLKSPWLHRWTAPEEPTEFGAVAAAIGCDIQLGGERVDLYVGNERVFTFPNEPNTIYEISNTPPDVNSSVGSTAVHHHGAGHSGSTLMSGPGSHFQHYYDLFPSGFEPKYNLQTLTGSKAPDPALCGSVRLGVRVKRLGEDSIA